MGARPSRTLIFFIISTLDRSYNGCVDIYKDVLGVSMAIVESAVVLRVGCECAVGEKTSGAWLLEVTSPTET